MKLYPSAQSNIHGTKPNCDRVLCRWIWLQSRSKYRYNLQQGCKLANEISGAGGNPAQTRQCVLQCYSRISLTPTDDEPIYFSVAFSYSSPSCRHILCRHLYRPRQQSGLQDFLSNYYSRFTKQHPANNMAQFYAILVLAFAFGLMTSPSVAKSPSRSKAPSPADAPIAATRKRAGSNAPSPAQAPIAATPKAATTESPVASLPASAPLEVSIGATPKGATTESPVASPPVSATSEVAKTPNQPQHRVHRILLRLWPPAPSPQAQVLLQHQKAEPQPQLRQRRSWPSLEHLCSEQPPSFFKLDAWCILSIFCVHLCFLAFISWDLKHSFIPLEGANLAWVLRSESGLCHIIFSSALFTFFVCLFSSAVMWIVWTASMFIRHPNVLISFTIYILS